MTLNKLELKLYYSLGKSATLSTEDRTMAATECAKICEEEIRKVLGEFIDLEDKSGEERIHLSRLQLKNAMLHASTHQLSPSAIDELIEQEVKKLSSPKSDNDGWISVKTQRPPVAEMVLLSNIKDKWVVAGERIGKKYWNQFEDELSGDVSITPTHWQPLPKAPKPLTGDIK